MKGQYISYYNSNSKEKKKLRLICRNFFFIILLKICQNGKIETENTSTKGTDGVLKTLAVKDFLERSGGGSYQGCIAL